MARSLPESRDGESKVSTVTASLSLAKDDQYPSNGKRILIMSAMYLAIFLVNLDQNVISTAIPQITNDFHSLNDIAWYGSAYILTTCSFQLLMGKVYKFYPVKPTFLACCIVFEVGSVVCGAAPNSTVFIVGRAVAGLGSAGIFSGVMVVIFHIIPLRQRPIYQGLFAAIFALASVIGPLLGGVFTDKLTWRWCFYINIPIGAISIIVTILLLNLSNQELDARGTGWWAKLHQLDPIGNLVFFPGIVCLILALQWGGTEYSWSNARIIVLLVLCGILCIAFIGIQAWKKENATVPPRLMKQRSVAAVAWFGFFNGASMLVVMYYLPVWFQAIKGASAVESGIMLLPMVLSTVICAIVSGGLTSKLGYSAPFLLLSSTLMPIGAGLLTTLTPTTNQSQWIGYQILFGIGLGLAVSQPMTVVQTVLEKSDIATGSSLVMFTRWLGSAVFLPVAQNIFLTNLTSRLSTNIPGLEPSRVIDAGATNLKSLVTAGELDTLLADYNAAIVNIFYMVAATSAITMFGSIAVEWRSLKKRADQEQTQSRTKQDEEVKEAEVSV